MAYGTVFWYKQATHDSLFVFVFFLFSAYNMHLGICANTAENKDIKTAIKICIIILQLYCKITIIIIILLNIN